MAELTPAGIGEVSRTLVGGMNADLGKVPVVGEALAANSDAQS